MLYEVITVSEAERVDARVGCRERFHTRDSGRGFDEREPSDACSGDLELCLERRGGRGGPLEARGALGFGQHDRAYARANDRLEIGLEVRRLGRIHAHGQLV